MRCAGAWQGCQAERLWILRQMPPCCLRGREAAEVAWNLSGSIFPFCRFVDNLQTRDARVARASSTMPRNLAHFLARGVRPPGPLPASIALAAPSPRSEAAPPGTAGAAAAAGVIAAAGLSEGTSPAVLGAAAAASVQAAEQRAAQEQEGA